MEADDGQSGPTLTEDGAWAWTGNEWRPTISPDGRLHWDGQTWRSRISDDGTEWWDGRAWRPWPTKVRRSRKRRIVTGAVIVLSVLLLMVGALVAVGSLVEGDGCPSRSEEETVLATLASRPEQALRPPGASEAGPSDRDFNSGYYFLNRVVRVPGSTEDARAFYRHELRRMGWHRERAAEREVFTREIDGMDATIDFWDDGPHRLGLTLTADPPGTCFD